MNVNDALTVGKQPLLGGLNRVYYCDDMALKDRIRTARRAARLTQAQLAELIGVSSQAVTQWEVGQKRDGVVREIEPSKENLLLIARHTRVPLEWLMTGHPLPEQDANGRLLFASDGVRTVPLLSMREAASDQPIDQKTPRIPAAFACGPRAFAVQAVDQANSPVIDPGDKVIIDPDRKTSPNQLVMALPFDSDEPIIGRLAYETTASGHIIIVRPVNQAFKAARSDHGSLAIIGAVTEVSKPLN